MSRPRDSLLFFLPMGDWFLTPVYVSTLFVLMAGSLTFQLGDSRGITLAGTLWLLVFFRELIRLSLARQLEIAVKDVILYPFGSSYVAKAVWAGTSRWPFEFAGWLTISTVAAAGWLWHRFEPIPWVSFQLTEVPRFDSAGVHWSTELFADLVWAATVLTLANLLPIKPLDGGRWLELVARKRLGNGEAQRFTALVGMGATFTFMMAAVTLDQPWIVFWSALLLCMNLTQAVKSTQSHGKTKELRTADGDGLFSGELHTRQRAQTSFLSRWQQQRRARQAERDAVRILQEEQLLDDVLAKLHLSGLSSLSANERRILKQASARRNKKP